VITEFDRLQSELEEAKTLKARTVVTGYHINGKSFVPEEQLKAALEKVKELKAAIKLVLGIQDAVDYDGPQFVRGYNKALFLVKSLLPKDK